MCNNDESNHTALKNRQTQVSKDINTHKNTSFVPTGSIVAVQQEHGGLWTHGTIVRHGAEDNRGTSYKIRVTKTRCIITRVKRHVKATPISVEDYLRKDMSKANRTQTINSMNLWTTFVQLMTCSNEHLNEMETEENDTIPRAI